MAVALERADRLEQLIAAGDGAIGLDPAVGLAGADQLELGPARGSDEALDARIGHRDPRDQGSDLAAVLEAQEQAAGLAQGRDPSLERRVGVGVGVGRRAQLVNRPDPSPCVAPVAHQWRNRGATAAPRPRSPSLDGRVVERAQMSNTIAMITSLAEMVVASAPGTALSLISSRRPRPARRAGAGC